MVENLPLLSVVIWVPAVGGIAVLLQSRAGDHALRWLSVAVASASFLVSIPHDPGFDFTTADMQFAELAPWIETLNVNYRLGVDGIAVPLILLTTFMTVLVVIAGWEVIRDRVAQYFAAFLIMEGLMNGVFAALD